MKLYIWGSENEVGKFDPESIALFIYLKLNDRERKVDVVPSCSADSKIAFMNKFPFLVSEDPNGEICITQGYYKITRLLKKKNEQGKETDANANAEIVSGSSQDDSLLNHALVSFMTNKFKLLNYYCYFLDDANYFGYTLRLFRHYLPFALSYYIPSQLKRQIEQESEVIGVHSDQIEVPKEEISLGKLHSDLSKSNRKSLNELKKLTTHHRIINLTRQYMERLHIHSSNNILLSSLNDYIDNESSPKLDDSQTDGKSVIKNEIDQKYNGTLSEVDILLISNVICLINNDLPENFLKAEFTSKYSDLVKLADKFSAELAF